MGKERISYTAKQKLAVISYAEAHGNRAAGREFTVNESNVRAWRRQKDRLKKMPKTKQADRGSKAHYPAIEEKLVEWITDRRKQGIAVSTLEIRLQAQIYAKQSGSANFKGSVSWCYKFLKRNDLSIRRRTHIAQKLPEDYEEKLTEFQRYVINLRKNNDYDLSQIGNADQTPMTFDLPASTTIAPKGMKTVSINTTGNEKNRFTVMLGCTADGGKLPPFVIFKRKTLPKDFNPPKGIIVRTQEKGWMDDPLVMDWVKNVWEKRPGAGLKKSLLVLDAFRCHKSEKVKGRLQDNKTNLVIIPGGMTSILQPLDVSVNRPLKQIMQRKWNEWYSSGHHTYTAGGRLRKAGLEEICTWIVEAWEEIDQAIISYAFKKCSISNALDGTEDDVLWDSTETEQTPCQDDNETDFYDDKIPQLSADDVRVLFELFEDDDSDTEFEGFGPDD